MLYKFVANTENILFIDYQWRLEPGALSCLGERYEHDLKYTISAGMAWLDKRPKGYINFNKDPKVLDRSSSESVRCLKDILRKAAHSTGADDVESLISVALFQITQAKRYGWAEYQSSLQGVLFAKLSN